MSGLEFILYSDIDSSIEYHLAAKSLSSNLIPPLAQLYLDKKQCGGLADLFFVAAVTLKQLVDAHNVNLQNESFVSDGRFKSRIDIGILNEGLKTLITLTSDSGLSNASESHLHLAMNIHPEDMAFKFRATLMTPGIYNSFQHLLNTRLLLETRVNALFKRFNDTVLSSSLSNIDEFILSPTFYYAYQGFVDKTIFSKIFTSYCLAYPPFCRKETNFLPLLLNKSDSMDKQLLPPSSKPIRVGFVSSYFRRHSICKLFCGLITSIDKSKFEVFVFSSLQESNEDAFTYEKLKNHIDSKHFITVGKTLVQNRQEVTSRNIEILIFLDIGMEPSTTVWAASRLAPIQVCTWGHPSTTGLPAMDFFISSDLFYPKGTISNAIFDERLHEPCLSVDVSQENSECLATIQFTSEYKMIHPGLDIVATQNEVEKTIKAFNRSIFETIYPSSVYSEQLLLLSSLGFYFYKPSFKLGSVELQYGEQSSQSSEEWARKLIFRSEDHYKSLYQLYIKESTTSKGSKDLIRLLKGKLKKNIPLILCPQHLPKFHPTFDEVLLELLIRSPTARVVIIDNPKKFQWRKALMDRWKSTLLSKINSTASLSSLSGEQLADSLLSRIYWTHPLSPSEYLALMAIGDVMLDPFPFGGGVTIMESFSMLTPVVTIGTHYQHSIPALAHGIISALELSPEVVDLMVAPNISAYIDNVLRLLPSENRSIIPDHEEFVTQKEPSFQAIDQYFRNSGHNDIACFARYELLINSHKVFENIESVREWEKTLSFLSRLYR